MRRIVLASSNPGKVREIQDLLADCGIEILPQSEFGIADADEGAPTFVENALLKARHASREAGLPALADDSGLVVDALSGAPGVRSARFAGPGASDRDNTQKLLDSMAGVAEPARTACFRCVIVLLQHPDDPSPLLAEGSWEGHIVRAPRGTQGFGYDPVFVPAGCTRTAAELAPVEKNRLSHRGRALSILAERIRLTR